MAITSLADTDFPVAIIFDATEPTVEVAVWVDAVPGIALALALALGVGIDAVAIDDDDVGVGDDDEPECVLIREYSRIHSPEIAFNWLKI